LSHEQKSIQLLSVTGEQRHRVRLPFADAPLNASIASRLIDSQYTAATEVLRSRGSPVTIDRFQHAAGVYRPRRVVPISGLVVGDDGAVLLRGNDWTGSTVTYAWLRPNGTLRGTLVLPIAHTIKALRGDVIWSVHETEAGLLRLLRQTVGER
jgi:hypothetical protein